METSDCVPALDLFFKRNKTVIVRHNIELFDQFISGIIPDIINNENIINEKSLKTKNIRHRFIFDNRSTETESKIIDEERDVIIAKIPIVMRSNYFKYVKVHNNF